MTWLIILWENFQSTMKSATVNFTEMKEVRKSVLPKYPFFAPEFRLLQRLII